MAVAYRLLAESIVAQVSFEPIAWSCGSIDWPDPYAFIDRKPRGTDSLLMYGVSGSSVCPFSMSAVSVAAPLVYVDTFGHQRSVRQPLCVKKMTRRFGGVVLCAFASFSATDCRNGAARETPPMPLRKTLRFITSLLRLGFGTEESG